MAPRFLLYVLLAAAAFAALVQFQFGKSRAFARRAGNLVVEGRYAGNGTPRALDGAVRVFFGGMEFLPPGARTVTFLDDGVSFGLDGDSTLSFTTQYTGGALELIMEAVFPEGRELPVEIPYRPLKTSSIREEGASFTVNSDRVNYVFTRAQALRRLGAERVLRLDPEERVAGYRALLDRKTINPDDFILAEARDGEAYEGALTLWRDKSYSAWNRAVSSPGAAEFFSGDGETANAFISEAVRRGTYRSAAQAVNAVYAPAAGAWEASAYLGKLEAALRSLSATERDRYTRLARLFNEKSPDFLKEFRAVEFLGIRGYGSLLDDAAEQLRAFDPAMMTLEQSAGFLEGLLDWTQARPDRDNPFVRFGDQAFYVAGDGLRKNPFGGAVLAFSGDEADIELNLRLGISLSRLEDETRRALGRTLTLSVLSLADESGSAPRVVVQRNGGDFAEKPETGRLSSARMYRICGTDGTYARALPVITAQDARSGLWAWTAAQTLEIGRADPASSDITVQFSAGETHYLLLRGVRPFARIQLHGADISSDPQFERYDASGWAYSAQEQTLMVKLKHRLPAEHIVILQTAAPEPEPPPAETDTET